MLDHQATKLYRFSMGDMSEVDTAPPLFRRYSPLAYVARQDLGRAQSLLMHNCLLLPSQLVLDRHSTGIFYLQL
jgi:hypothetical protein